MHFARSSRLSWLVTLAAISACAAPQERIGSVRAPGPTYASANGPSTRESIPDDAISDGVRERLSADGALRNAKLHVQTTNGIVELTGVTDNLLAVERAAAIAETIKGVRAVSNRIALDSPHVGDAELARTLEDALHADPATEGLVLPLAVEGGVVHLRGNVHSVAEKRFAEQVVKGVRGVTRVDNLIDVTWSAARSDADIRRDVTARLRWDALVDSTLVQVQVSEGKVTLIGFVGSAAEKSEAERVSWVTGTTAVDPSLLSVEPWARRADLRRAKDAEKPDAEVAQAIAQALSYDPRVRSCDVHVEVEGRRVTLSGHVPNLAASYAAERVAKDTVGVNAVANTISVAYSKPVTDAKLEARVTSALAREPFLEPSRISATVKEGAVLLRGQVASSFEKASASAAVAALGGVKAIANELEVDERAGGYVYSAYVDQLLPRASLGVVTSPHPTLPDRAVVLGTERALRLSPYVDANDVHVVGRGGKVTLNGTVNTWRQKAIATECALRAGAVSVDNLLVVQEP